MDQSRPIFKAAISGLFMVYFQFFNIVDSKQMFYRKNCQWLDLNRRPLVSEATALPTEPQPLLTALFLFIFVLFKHKNYKINVSFTGIRTPFVRVEGKHTDHLTTTTPLYWTTLP